MPYALLLLLQAFKTVQLPALLTLLLGKHVAAFKFDQVSGWLLPFMISLSQVELDRKSRLLPQVLLNLVSGSARQLTSHSRVERRKLALDVLLIGAFSLRRSHLQATCRCRWCQTFGLRLLGR